VVTRIGGQRFALQRHFDAFARLDALSVATSTAIAFVNRSFYYNPQTGALDSLGLNATRIRLTRNRDGLGAAVTLPTTPAVTAGRRFTAIHGVGDDTLTPGPLNTALGRRYGYDDLGRVNLDLNAARDRWRAFTYDGLGRLTNVSFEQPIPDVGPCSNYSQQDGWTCTGSQDSSKTYGYDQVGNRTDQSGTYTTGNRIATMAGFTFEHDLDGNVSRKYGNGQDVRYYWSADGRLDSTVAGTTRIAYSYDAGGRLVRKRRNGVDQRFFLWDGAQLLAELDGTAQQRVGEYAYYPGIDAPLALVTGATSVVLTRFHRQDLLGNVSAVLRDTSRHQTVTYDTWGKQQLVTGTLADSNRLRWKGLLWEGDSTRLYYMRARWYDPSAGRFFSEDPIGLRGGVNQYTFVADNPVNGRDPTGRRIEWKGGCAYSVVDWEVSAGGKTWSGTDVRLIGCITGGGGSPGGSSSDGLSGGSSGLRGIPNFGGAGGPGAGPGPGSGQISISGLPVRAVSLHHDVAWIGCKIDPLVFSAKDALTGRTVYYFVKALSPVIPTHNNSFIPGGMRWYQGLGVPAGEGSDHASGWVACGAGTGVFTVWDTYSP
jgi:RHS repeat-associated protein